jgi:hypothetical protein
MVWQGVSWFDRHMEHPATIAPDWTTLRIPRVPPPRGRRLGIVLLLILAAATLPWLASAGLSWLTRTSPHQPSSLRPQSGLALMLAVRREVGTVATSWAIAARDGS